MIIVGGCCYSSLPVKFLLWIAYLPRFSVDHFHKKSERNISVVIQSLAQLFSGLAQLFNTFFK